MSANQKPQNEDRLINFNGKLISGSGPLLEIENRSFRYGDGMFETVRMVNSHMPLFPLHYKRLRFGCDLLKLKLPSNWNEKSLAKEITKVVKENGLEKNARIRLTIYRRTGGYYLPVTNEADYIIEVSAVKKEDFGFNQNGLKVDLFTDIEKPTTQFSEIKTNNALIYVLAALHKQENDLDDCLLINNRSRVIESIDSNLFVLLHDEVHTPPTTEGCVAGVMREYVIEMIKEEDIPFKESALSLEELFGADEMFLTNSIQGIKWISQYKIRHYGHQLSQKLSQMLDSRLMNASSTFS